MNYVELLKNRNIKKMLGTNFLLRSVSWLLNTAIVVFALDYFKSATLAGTAVFFSGIFSIVLGPFIGTAIDRYNKNTVIRTSLLGSALPLILIPFLARAELLSELSFMLLIIVSGIFKPIALTAIFTIFPILIPKDHWDAANALDGINQEMAVIVGQLFVSVVFVFASSSIAILIAGVIYLIAFFLIRLDEKELARNKQTDETNLSNIWQDMVQGIKYVFIKNSILRSISLFIPVYVITFGSLSILIPLIVKNSLNGNEGLIGILWAVEGIAALLSNFIFGKFSTEGKEKKYLLLGMLGSGIGFLLLVFKLPLFMIFVALCFIGGTQGMVDISLNSLKQRATSPEWYGRAFSVCGTMIGLGMPIGSFIAGSVSNYSYSISLFIPITACMTAVLLIVVGLKSLK